MSIANASGVRFDAAALDTLRRAQLAQTVESLDLAGDAFHRMGDEPDVSDPGRDVVSWIVRVREDLDALEALGYRDEAGVER